MTTASTGGGEAGDALAQAHAALRADKALQFDFSAPPTPRPPPPWLAGFSEFMKSIGPVAEWIVWIVVGLVVLAVLAFIAREVVQSRFPKLFKPRPMGAEPAWKPTEVQARVLLADADRLAAEGRFAEAAHLVLRRSVEDIRERRPRLVRPALTSRDIAVHPDLPEVARGTFSGIARVVERSRFGGRPVEAPDWTAVRDAYEAFAFA